MIYNLIKFHQVPYFSGLMSMLNLTKMWRFRFSDSQCWLWLLADYGYATIQNPLTILLFNSFRFVSTMNVVFIALDRFLSIKEPYAYRYINLYNAMIDTVLVHCSEPVEPNAMES